MLYILGLDGLEHNLVEDWNLSNLKQEEYGKIKVEVNIDTGYPLTAEVWASFLTGKKIRISFNQKPSQVVLKVKTILRFFRRYIPLNLGLGRLIFSMIPKSLPRAYVSNELSLPKTFLDLTNSKPINVPYYNQVDRASDVLKAFDDGRINLAQSINLFKQLYIENKTQILTESISNVDVLFAYMHFPDLLCHLCLRETYIKELYFDLNYFVGKLKNQLGNVNFLVVSDHGFDLKTGMHTDYGFYSSNFTLKPKPKCISDFYNLIVGLSETPRCSLEKPLTEKPQKYETVRMSSLER